MTALEPDLAAIKARLAAATPGPWVTREHSRVDVPVCVETDEWPSDPVAWFGANLSNAKADAVLVAHAPADLAALVAYAEQIKADLAAEKAAREKAEAALIACQKGAAAMREALWQLEAAVGDRLLAERPLSEPYAHGVLREIKAALASDAGAALLAKHKAEVERLRTIEAAARAIADAETTDDVYRRMGALRAALEAK